MAWSLYVKTDLGANQRCRDAVCRRLEVRYSLDSQQGSSLLGQWGSCARQLSISWVSPRREHPQPQSCCCVPGAILFPPGERCHLGRCGYPSWKQQGVAWGRCEEAAGCCWTLAGAPWRTSLGAELCQRFLVCWVAGRGHGAGGFHPVLCGSATTSEKEGRKGGSEPLSWLARGRMTKSSKCSEHIGSPGKVWKMGGRKNHCPTKHLDAGSWERAGGAAEEECRACLKSPSSREENLQQEAEPGI